MRERRNDVRHDVTSVIENHVRRSELFDYFTEKLCVLLIPNSNSYLLFLIGSTVLVDVDTNNLGQRPKVPFQKLKGTAGATSNLKERHRSVDVAAKMHLIRGKIVRPLVNGAALVVQ